jgi:hypothetical protein
MRLDFPEEGRVKHVEQEIFSVGHCAHLHAMQAGAQLVSR